MKKLLTVLLAALLLVSVSACKKENEKEGYDFSQKPANFEEWTTQDVIDYFEAIGVMTDKDAQFIQTKDYPDYNPAPESLTELGSYMTDTDTVLIYWMDPKDTREEVVNNMTTLKDTMSVNLVYGEEVVGYPCNYAFGRFGFTTMTSNPEFDMKLDAGMKALAAHFNLECRTAEISFE